MGRDRRPGLLGRFRNRRGDRAAPAHRDDTDRADDPADGPADGTGADEDRVVELDDHTFEAGTEGGWTVVDFWAAWCGPCRIFEPVFHETAREWVGVRFARCNVDASPRTAAAWGIMTIPTVSLFDPDGNEVERVVGVPSHQVFRRLLERAAHD